MNPLTLAEVRKHTGRQLTYAEAITLANPGDPFLRNMAVALSLHTWNNTAQDWLRLELSSKGAQQLHCEVPISFPPKERLRFLLAAKRRDDSGMRCHHLRRQHPLNFVLGADTRYRRQYLVDVAFARWIFPAPIACSI